MRNVDLGVSRRDMIIFVGGCLVALALTLVWHFFLEGPIGRWAVENLGPGNEQPINKYFLTGAILWPLALLVTFASLLTGNREDRSGRRRMFPGFLVRLGLALQFFGTLIMPLALVYASDPSVSVPVGFAAFSTVFPGLVIAGIGGNMLAPRRA